MRVNLGVFSMTALLVSLGAEDDELDAVVARLETYPGQPTTYAGVASTARTALESYRLEKARALPMA